MLVAKRPTAALLVLAFFSIAILCAEANRSAVRSVVSINSRPAEPAHAPAGQRKAIKRTVYVEDEAPSSESAATQWRYLSSKERRVETPIEGYEVLASGAAPVQKVSTHLFLSVLNL